MICCYTRQLCTRFEILRSWHKVEKTEVSDWHTILWNFWKSNACIFSGLGALTLWTTSACIPMKGMQSKEFHPTGTISPMAFQIYMETTEYTGTHCHFHSFQLSLSVSVCVFETFYMDMSFCFVFGNKFLHAVTPWYKREKMTVCKH